MTQTLVATRAAGLAAMQAFSPAMGSRYANGRNYDRGPRASTGRCRCCRPMSGAG